MWKFLRPWSTIRWERYEYRCLLPKEDQQRILNSWNNTKTVDKKYDCIHQWIEACVARTPDAIAIIRGKTSLTYKELDHRAYQLARYLQGQGITPDTPVGIYMERSLEMIVAILGILESRRRLCACLIPTIPRTA